MKKIRHLPFFLLALLPMVATAQADQNLINNAKQGDLAAMVRLGECYELGAGVAHDSTQALYWFKKAAEMGDGEAWIRLSKYFLTGTGVPKDTARYLSIRTEWAEKELPNALAALGSAYEFGYGIDKDSIKALELYQQAAKKGSEWGNCRMGMLYMTSRLGIKEDKKKALSYLKKAAQGGDVNAPYFIAAYYANNNDAQEAWKWTREGMKWNEPNAITIAAQMYFNGLGVDNDEAKALQMLESLIDEHHNLNYSQNLTGAFFLEALPSLRDTAKALQIWRQGDSLGFADCQASLADFYTRAQEFDKALAYFRKILNNKDNESFGGEASFYAAKCLILGIGCTQDEAQGIALLKKGTELYNDAQCASALASIYSDEAHYNLPEAIKYLREADRLGNTSALGELGQLYANNGEPEKATECYQEMISRGNNEGYYYKGLALNNQGRDKECIKTFEEGAKKGSISCYVSLGLAYENGYSGVKQDLRKALKYYTKSQTPYALYRQGIILINNGLEKKKEDEIKQDESKGMDLIRQAADQGHTEAIYTLGYCYETGSHLDSIDHFMAVKYFKLLADNNIASGQFKMGLYYELGDGGVEADSVKAIEYYRLAANQGHGEALCYLGDFHRIGRFLPLDPKQAFAYYLQAHQAGEMIGTYYVGRSYLEGCGVDIDTATALPYLRAAAADGNGNAAYKIATFYNYGIGTLPPNGDSAMAYYVRGHQGGCADASYFIGHHLLKQNRYDEAVPYLTTAANRGSAEGMTEYAYCLQNGWGVPQADPFTAYKIWKYVTQHTNNSQAYCLLGVACLQGIGIVEDDVMGKAYLDTAANLGNTIAARNLGVCYRNGYGCDPDTSKAIQWLETAANNDDATSMNMLGNLYKSMKQYPEAVKWYEKSVEAGDMDGYCNLGYCYEEGLGVILNSQRAYELYMTPAVYGFPRGYRRIAHCYIDGIYVEQDMAEAYKWMEKAALAGDEEAMFYCGVMLENGEEGLPANKKKAREWYRKSADAGYEPAIEALQRLK